MFAYTTDTETSAEKQKERQIQQYKKKTLQEIMDVPKIIDDSNNNNNNFLNNTLSTSSTESLTKLNYTEKKKAQLKRRKETDKQKINEKENMLKEIKKRKIVTDKITKSKTLSAMHIAKKILDKNDEISESSSNDEEDNREREIDNRESRDEISVREFEKENASTIINNQSISTTSDHFENHFADNDEVENDVIDATKKGTNLLLRAILVNRQIMLKMKKEMEDLCCDIRQIQNNNSLHIFNPINDFGIEMPIKSMGDFLNFDLTLNNEDTAKKFVGFIKNCLDWSTNNPTKSIHAILRKIFTRVLALQFTAVRKSGDRTIFKITNTYKNIKDIIMDTHTTTEGILVNEKNFHTALGAGFANARDWDGHRSRH